MADKLAQAKQVKKLIKQTPCIQPRVMLLLVLTICTIFVSLSLAHPSSGIVVDQKGRVYFSDLSRGLLMIDERGKVTTVYKEGGHWLALDKLGSFSRVNFETSKHWPRWFKRRTPINVKPVLIGDGGSPLVVGQDGNLYFVCDDERMIPAGLQIGRLSPDGKETLLNPSLLQMSEKLGGIKGLASGPDGSLYASYAKAILKIKTDGRFSTLVNPVVTNACELNVPSKDSPWLRGLAVDSRGVVYAAASGCGSVLKIMPDGKVTTVLKAEKPWAPSGVAIHNNDVYVLEHINPNSDTHEDWPPRVRKLGRNGKVTTLATITR